MASTVLVVNISGLDSPDDYHAVLVRSLLLYIHGHIITF